MVGVKAASNSSASSSTSSVSSGVTSTVQRNRHIPISIASKNTSPQLRKPSPKQSTVRVQLNEFSVDFGDGRPETSNKQTADGKSPSLNKNSPSLDKKSPSLDKKSASSSSRKSSIASNISIGSNSSDKKVSSRKSSIASIGDKKPSDKTFTNLDRKTLSADRKSSISSTTSDKKASSLPTQQIATTSKPPIEKVEDKIKDNKEVEKQRSQDDNSSQIIVAEIHRSAEEAEDVNDNRLLVESPQEKEKSHEEQYRNSQTSDSVIVEDDKAVESADIPKPIKDDIEEDIQELVVIGHESEIEVDVSERKEEECNITTKIILDKDSRAIAAQDLEIEIRREVHTEVSPPISPESALIEDKPISPEPALIEDKPISPEPAIIEESKTSIEESKTSIEDEIKPFVFRESQTPQKQQFRDVAIRVIEQEVKHEPSPKEVTAESITQKAATPLEEVDIQVEERKRSIADLAEVRVYRERYSEAPILPYPADSTQKSTQIQEATNDKIPHPKLDLSTLNPRTEDNKPNEDIDKKQSRRPVITPISPGNKSPIVPKIAVEDNNQIKDQKQVAVTSSQRPRIIDDETPLAEADEAIAKLKREPIRLNIASSLHSPPSKISPPSQYENKPNGNNYPSSIEINGLYRPHPLYPSTDHTNKRRVYENCELGVKSSEKPINGSNDTIEKTVNCNNEKAVNGNNEKAVNGNEENQVSTTKTTTTTTLISTVISNDQNGRDELNVNPTQQNHPTNQLSHSSNEPSPTDRQLKAKASPTPSGRLSRLSVGTGEKSENDFTPRTLSRINHLNVIMECKNGEKDTGEVIHHHPIFMRDTSKYWYKPTISREEAITILKDKEPGTFVVRDSNSFPGAFGLALKVSQAPAGVQPGDGTELVRHFLIEPSTKGVKLKGCSNEPIFGTLAALIYQHSITPLALPAKLILPDYDPASTPEHLNANQALLERGAACNVTYICSLDTESLTGPEAVRRAVSFGLSTLNQKSLHAVPVHFKVSAQGITLTDNTRSLFFRRHYPVTTVTFAGIDPESRLFDNNNASQLPSTYIRQAPMFGFVARKSPSSLENTCHVFSELDPEQPASAVVRFITNVMMVQARAQQQQIHRAVAGV